MRCFYSNHVCRITFQREKVPGGSWPPQFRNPSQAPARLRACAATRRDASVSRERPSIPESYLLASPLRTTESHSLLGDCQDFEPVAIEGDRAYAPTNGANPLTVNTSRPEIRSRRRRRLRVVGGQLGSGRASFHRHPQRSFSQPRRALDVSQHGVLLLRKMLPTVPGQSVEYSGRVPLGRLPMTTIASCAATI